MADHWQSENIPDGDVLYMRLHETYVIDGNIRPGAFKDHNGAMSTNWSKYCSTPAQAKAMARDPSKNGVLSAVTHDIRKVPMVVEHTPDESRNDRSHTDVRGKKTSEARLKLLDAFSWCLRIGE